MPFGIPSEDFHGGFGLPYDEDDYDPYTGKYAFVSPDKIACGENHKLKAMLHEAKKCPLIYVGSARFNSRP